VSHPLLNTKNGEFLVDPPLNNSYNIRYVDSKTIHICTDQDSSFTTQKALGYLEFRLLVETGIIAQDDVVSGYSGDKGWQSFYHLIDYPTSPIDIVVEYDSLRNLLCVFGTRKAVVQIVKMFPVGGFHDEIDVVTTGVEVVSDSGKFESNSGVDVSCNIWNESGGQYGAQSYGQYHS